MQFPIWSKRVFLSKAIIKTCTCMNVIFEKLIDMILHKPAMYYNKPIAKMYNVHLKMSSYTQIFVGRLAIICPYRLSSDIHNPLRAHRNQIELGLCSWDYRLSDVCDSNLNNSINILWRVRTGESFEKLYRENPFEMANLHEK